MWNLLGAIITFVGVMLVLALAAQSVQEVLKAIFAFKSQTTWAAVDALVRESVRSYGKWSVDAEKILLMLRQRLQALGQSGVRKSAIRLDHVSADDLHDLLVSLRADLVPSFTAGEAETQQWLTAIADRVREWYPIAMTPVQDRYQRRMRMLALLCGVLVVVPANAGADHILHMAQTDPAFQQRVAGMVASIDATTKAVAAKAAAVPADAAHPAASAAEVTRLRTSVDSAKAALSRADALLPFSLPNRTELQQWSWWIGILVSILLVSLGAPFWHDLLETLVGWKTQMRAQGDQAASVASSTKDAGHN